MHPRCSWPPLARRWLRLHRACGRQRNPEKTGQLIEPTAAMPYTNKNVKNRGRRMGTDAQRQGWMALNAGTVTDHDAATQNMHPAMVRTASTGAARAAPAAQSPYKQPLLANSTTMAIQDRPQRSSPAKQPGQMQMQLERGLSAGVIDPEASGPAAGASPAIGSCDTCLFSRFPWKMLTECVSFPIMIAIFNRISSEYSGWKTFGLNHADCCTHMKECPIELPTSTVRLSERELKEAKKTAKAAHENNLFNSVCVAVLLNIRFSKLYPLHAGTNPLPNENNSTGTSGHASGIISRTR